MKRAFFLLILSFGIIVHSSTSAQYYTNQNKVWAFGVEAGLDFNSGIPVPISTNMNMGMGEPEGCASVCDSSGNLLFYSNGLKVYNKTGSVMPTGSSIVSFFTNSTEQAALIIPDIGNSNKYYLFSLESFGVDMGNCHLAYSIVDMTLDGGLGDIVASSIGTPLQDSLGENMIAITGNDDNIWLVTHRQDTALFLAFNITSAGISAPVISATGSFIGEWCYAWGMLRESPNRTKIAQGVGKAGGCYGAQLYDFDPSTGIVSNCMVIDTANNETYGVEFSPDNTKLYLNNSSPGSVFQYSINLPTLAAIQASKYVVTDSSDGADLRLGPDGKIYFKDGNTSDLDCIRYPNITRTGCGYVAHAVIFPSNPSYETFPNLYVTTDTVNRVGVSEIKNISNIIIYPNPATTFLTISANQINQITIDNLLGQTMYSHEYNSPQIQIDVANFPAGLYFVKINGSEVRKFVKQ